MKCHLQYYLKFVTMGTWVWSQWQCKPDHSSWHRNARRRAWTRNLDLLKHTLTGTQLVMHAITQTVSLSSQWSLLTIALGGIHIPVMKGIGVQVGGYSLMGWWVWHFTSLSITPTITSWHFCIRLIFEPLSLCSDECVYLFACVRWKWTINPLIYHQCKHLRL